MLIHKKIFGIKIAFLGLLEGHIDNVSTHSAYNKVSDGISRQ